ncbi:MAG: gluconate 2-dehydrogenase subunit 3 family protein [Bacteroidetes bacterium]|nr:MAG: gluconate 2-dehydrogenase subunit 3 family protein [Bacteroidota bacterium]
MDRRSLLKYTAYIMGYAVAAPFTSAILSGCQAEAPATGESYTPQALTAAEFAALSAMADTMLPATSTPSASELGVPAFVDLQLARYAEPEDKQRIYGGFKDWLAQIQMSFGKAYAELPAEQQLRLLNTLDKESIAAAEELDYRADIPDADKSDFEPWWLSLKSMIIGSYFSTELIGTQVLAYKPVPGPYQGCIPLEEATGGKAWSL